MTGFSVPIPPVPAWVSWSWTPTNSAIVVECSRCRGMVAIYATVLRKAPLTLADEVYGHWKCRG